MRFPSKAGAVKVHLKNAPTDHLSLCRMWPEKNWVLRTSALAQNAGYICKTCAQVAHLPESRDASRAASA